MLLRTRFISFVIVKNILINYNSNRSFSNRELFIDLMTSTDNAVLKSIGLFVRESNISEHGSYDSR